MSFVKSHLTHAMYYLSNVMCHVVCLMYVVAWCGVVTLLGIVTIILLTTEPNLNIIYSKSPGARHRDYGDRGKDTG